MDYSVPSAPYPVPPYIVVENSGAECCGCMSDSHSPDSNMAADSSAPPTTDSPRTLAEWITFVIATLILVVLVSLVVYDWQANQHRPPAFQIEVAESARVTNEQYYLPFTITNTGGRIARTVQVIAELQFQDGWAESGEQQIDFLSGNERKQGSFVFTRDPQSGNLTVRVASYGIP